MSWKWIVELVKEEIKDLKPCVHGGDVWRIAEEQRLEVREIIDFSANINPLGPSKRVLDKIRENLWKIVYYPDPECMELRKAISRYISGIKVDNVIIGNGSTELIYLFCEVFVNKGDSVLIPIPTFGEYERAVRKVGGVPIYVDLRPDFKVTSRRLLEKLTKRVKVIFLCNPNNPTGILASFEDVLEIVKRAAENKVLVVVDEAFIEFVDDEKRYSLATEVERYENLFVLRSLTKAFGLAGLRIGYGVACKDMIDMLSKAKLPWNVNTLAQVAAISALEDHEHLTNTRRFISEERKFLLSELEKISGLKVFPSDANFILMDVRSFKLTAMQLKEKMLLQGILIRDCSSFRGLDEYYVRVSIRRREENEKLLKCLKKSLSASST
ncbi:MAG: histidinol-phosphate transaminase [Candidatus Nezhaarchaeota archaeon]|nr:histidinol-phosphate transaminase [Candidatus Nezhaarchaeota archaeon]